MLQNILWIDTLNFWTAKLIFYPVNKETIDIIITPYNHCLL